VFFVVAAEAGGGSDGEYEAVDAVD